MNLTSYAIWQPRAASGQFIAAKVDDAVTAAITEWAEKVLTTAQSICPVDTGALRASGHVEVASTGKTAAVAVVFDAPYSIFVEFGYGQRGAASPGAGDGPYGNRPGAPAQPFLRPAYDQLRDEAPGLAREKIAAALG
jgi:HK97 gp10 family phage protein